MRSIPHCINKSSAYQSLNRQRGMKGALCRDFRKAWKPKWQGDLGDLFCGKSQLIDRRNPLKLELLRMLDPQFRYPDEEHADYEREGYCFFRHFLTNEALSECRRNVDRIVAHLQPGRSPEEVFSAHQTGEEWIFQ